MPKITNLESTAVVINISGCAQVLHSSAFYANTRSFISSVDGERTRFPENQPSAHCVQRTPVHK